MPKLIYTVILWYRFVVRPPPPSPGGNNTPWRHANPPTPLGGEPARQKGGDFKGGDNIIIGTGSASKLDQTV